MKRSILLAIALFSCTILLAQDNQVPLIEVIGKSEKSVQPDEAIFVINLMEKSMEVDDAVKMLNQKAENLSEGLKKSKIKNYKLVSDNYSVRLNRVYRSGQARDSGYVASQTIRITSANINEGLQKIANAIQESGDLAFNLGFQVSEKTRKSLEDDLLAEALKNAEKQAELIANTMGIKDIKIYNISLDPNPLDNVVRPMMARMASDSGVQEMLIQTEGQKISKQVLVKYTFLLFPN